MKRQRVHAPKTPPKTASSRSSCPAHVPSSACRTDAFGRTTRRAPGDEEAPACRRRPRRQGNRDRGRRGPSLRWKSWARPAWEEMTEQLQRACSPTSAAARRRRAQDAHRRGAQAADRGRGGQARQRRRRQGPGARQCRAERHRLHRRDRQGRLPLLGDTGRRRLAPGRAARPAAACRRNDRQHQVWDGQDGSHPVHRLGGVSSSLAKPS